VFFSNLTTHELVTPLSSNAPSGPGERTGHARVIGRGAAGSTPISPTPMLERPRASRALKKTRAVASDTSTTGSAAWVAAHVQSWVPSQTIPSFRHRLRDEGPASEADLITALREQLGALRHVDAALDGVLHDDGAGADQRSRRDRDRVSQRGVDADERIAAHVHMAGDDRMRRDEAMILDRRVV